MTGDESHTLTIAVEKIEKMPELKVTHPLLLCPFCLIRRSDASSRQENPFKRRICEVFSHDGSGNMTFDDFLDMLNVFSESAPRDLKVYYAFKIYGRDDLSFLLLTVCADYDGDHFITAYDIEQTTIALTRNELSPDEIQDVCDRVIEEANNDDDGVISLAEFQAVISRSPDFLR